MADFGPLSHFQYTKYDQLVRQKTVFIINTKYFIEMVRVLSELLGVYFDLFGRGNEMLDAIG